MNEQPILIGDIGGTNARFALAASNKIGFSHAATLKCAEFSSVELAIGHYLRQLDIEKPDAICLVAAGPVVDQQVKMTNTPWIVSRRALQRRFPECRVALINDFTAIALSVPHFAPGDILNIGSVNAPRLADRPGFTVGIVGPGTGLGVSGLIKSRQSLTPLATEGGHVGFAPENRLQQDVLRILRERWPRVSAERLLAGTGLENIHWALARLNKEAADEHCAADIFQQAKDRNALACQSVQMYFEILGQFAGDIALTLGAKDGVFIAGGIIKRYPELIVQSGFRTAFENKGRHAELMKTIPTHLILHPEPGLLGAGIGAGIGATHGSSESWVMG